MPPSLSVVIPTRERPDSLIAVLDALSRQEDIDLQRVEVVVVCDGVGDPAFEAVQRGWYPMRIRLADQIRQGPAAARNHGLAVSTGQVIVFLDDDTVPEPAFLSVHQRAHSEAPDVVAMGPVLPPPGDGTPWARWEERMVAERYAAMAEEDGDVSPRQFSTGNASIRRLHLVRAFGFDVTFPRGEDVELAFRLRDRGLRFRFLPEATVQHLGEGSYPSWVERAQAEGHFEVQMGRDRGHGDLLEAVAREFGDLRPLTRLLVRASIRSSLVARGAARAARPVSLLCDRLGAPRLAESAVGAVHNAVRLAGFASEVGGSGPALRLLDGADVFWPGDTTPPPHADPPPGHFASNAD